MACTHTHTPYKGTNSVCERDRPNKQTKKKLNNNDNNQSLDEKLKNDDANDQNEWRKHTFTGHQLAQDATRIKRHSWFGYIVKKKSFLFCAFIRINLFIWKDDRFLSSSWLSVFLCLSLCSAHSLSLSISPLNNHRTTNRMKNLA